MIKINFLIFFGFLSITTSLFCQPANVETNMVKDNFIPAALSMADNTVLIDNLQIIDDKVTSSLQKYRQQLEELRKEFRAVDMPNVRFFLFGMGNRTKLLYKNGKLINAITNRIIKEWPVKNETIIPNDYRVNIETSTNRPVSIFENEKGVFINEGGEEILVEGTGAPVNLPNFEKYKYGEVLKVLRPHKGIWFCRMGGFRSIQHHHG